MPCWKISTVKKSLHWLFPKCHLFQHQKAVLGTPKQVQTKGPLKSFQSSLCWTRVCVCVCVCANSLEPCLTLCDPMGCSPPGSSVHGILQARIQEWVPSSSSRESSCAGIKPVSPASAAGCLPLASPGKSRTLVNLLHHWRPKMTEYQERLTLQAREQRTWDLPLSGPPLRVLHYIHPTGLPVPSITKTVWLCSLRLTVRSPDTCTEQIRTRVPVTPPEEAHCCRRLSLPITSSVAAAKGPSWSGRRQQLPPPSPCWFPREFQLQSRNESIVENSRQHERWQRNVRKTRKPNLCEADGWRNGPQLGHAPCIPGCPFPHGLWTSHMTCSGHRWSIRVSLVELEKYLCTGACPSCCSENPVIAWTEAWVSSLKEERSQGSERSRLSWDLILQTKQSVNHQTRVETS